MSAARRGPCSASFAWRSSTSTSPVSVHATTTTRMPAITADAAVGFAVGQVPAADREEPGELALAAGVGLHRDGVVAGDVAEPPLELGDHLPVPDRLVERRERVDVGEARPRD